MILPAAVNGKVRNPLCPLGSILIYGSLISAVAPSVADRKVAGTSLARITFELRGPVAIGQPQCIVRWIRPGYVRVLAEGLKDGSRSAARDAGQAESSSSKTS
jgi:hypothetical protein